MSFQPTQLSLFDAPSFIAGHDPIASISVTKKAAPALSRVHSLNYNPYQAALNPVLLQLLNQQAKQPRWQLWLSVNKTVNKKRLLQANVPVKQTVTYAVNDNHTAINNVEQALLSGNYSTIVVHAKQISRSQKLQWQIAAEKMNAVVIILNEMRINTKSATFH